MPVMPADPVPSMHARHGPSLTCSIVLRSGEVNQQNTKTVVLPEKRIAKQNQAPTKIGSKTIPDILIVNRSHQREMITRSLGIHDLVGV